MSEENEESPFRGILPILEEAKRANERMQEFLDREDWPGGRIAFVGNVPDFNVTPEIKYIVSDEPDAHEPNGRDVALPYVDPFVDAELGLLDDALDAEFIARRDGPPEDKLDRILEMEAHIAICEECAHFYNARVCEHCLDLRYCEPIASRSRAAAGPAPRAGGGSPPRGPRLDSCQCPSGRDLPRPR